MTNQQVIELLKRIDAASKSCCECPRVQDVIEDMISDLERIADYSV